MGKAQAVVLDPKLTEPQRYALGLAVESSYLRQGWEGDLKVKSAPSIRGKGWRGDSVSIPSIKALLRQGVIGTSTNEIYPLTRIGIEIGEAECLERTGRSPKEAGAQARRELEEKNRAKAVELETALAPFGGLKVTVMKGGKKRTVSFDKYLHDELARRGYVQIGLDLLRQIGEKLVD